MAKYRAVFLVPSIVEFECDGTISEASDCAKDLADGMGKASSLHPQRADELYVPKVLEVVVTDGSPKPELSFVA